MIFDSNDAFTLKVKMDMRSDKYHIGKPISENAGFDRICEYIENHSLMLDIRLIL